MFEVQGPGPRIGRKATFSTVLVAVILAAAMVPSTAPAVLGSPITVDGPDPGITEFGGVAMAPDGTGGLVYLKTIGGVSHVFASRFDGSSWSPPVRVDWDQPFEASQPRIAAGSKGELLVVWVTETATVSKSKGKSSIQRGLYSARLGRGAAEFGPSLLVDPNVGKGDGVDPSIAGVSGGKAIVAYRAVTYGFSQEEALENAENQEKFVQLRPGDVMAEIRLARLTGERWARLGAVNRNLSTSMRSPSALNAPQVGIGDDGGAVVAWQEPDQTGTARIWVRRIYGTTAGPLLEASPTTWSGSPVSVDIDAFSLAVTPFDAAYIAMRTAPEGGRSRLFLNSLPVTTSASGKSLTGPELVGAPAPFGPPALAASEAGGGEEERAVRLAVAAGSQVDQFGAAAGVKLKPVPMPDAPPAASEAEIVDAVDYEGNGVVAFPTAGPEGGRLAVRQEFSSGAVQSGVVSGARSGPIEALAIGRSGAGDALIGFLQGEPGHYEVVAERVSAPPARFPVQAPPRWVKPRRALIRWKPAPSATGGTTYSVLLDGRMAKAGLARLRYTPNVAQLGDGTIEAQVLATDQLGQRLLSKPVKLHVDALPPKITVREQPSRKRVTIKVEDADSGVRRAATRVAFGDGARARHGARFAHAYAAAGTYSVIVKAGDRVGNRVTRRFEVKVR